MKKSKSKTVDQKQTHLRNNQTMQVVIIICEYAGCDTTGHTIEEELDIRLLYVIKLSRHQEGDAMTRQKSCSNTQTMGLLPVKNKTIHLFYYTTF